MSGHTTLPPPCACSAGHRRCCIAAVAAAAWQMPLCCAHLRLFLRPAASYLGLCTFSFLSRALWALAALCRHRQLITDRGVQPVWQIRDVNQQEPQLLQGLQMGGVLQACVWFAACRLVGQGRGGLLGALRAGGPARGPTAAGPCLSAAAIPLCIHAGKGASCTGTITLSWLRSSVAPPPLACCSRECQLADWPAHKEEYKRIQRQRQEEAAEQQPQPGST